MIGEGLTQKSVAAALESNPIMPAVSFPIMHPIAAANDTATITYTAVSLARQNGTLGLPVGQLSLNGMK
jgi:hypothetical protein